jgi:hypothetical protein
LKTFKTIGEERDAQKARWAAYRAAAQRLYPYVTVRHQCAVNESADGEGAFLEVVIFVPYEQTLPPPPSRQMLLDFNDFNH